MGSCEFVVVQEFTQMPEANEESPGEEPPGARKIHLKPRRPTWSQEDPPGAKKIHLEPRRST